MSNCFRVYSGPEVNLGKKKHKEKISNMSIQVSSGDQSTKETRITLKKGGRMRLYIMLVGNNASLLTS